MALPSKGVPIGTIVAFAFTTLNIPGGWLPCDGSPIDCTKYKDLCDGLGSTQTPNLAGMALIGGGGSYVLGQTGGEVQHTLTTDEMPQHHHSINGGNFGTYTDSFSGYSEDDQHPFETEPTGNKVWGTDDEGQSAAHNNMQPYYVVNYIIFAGPE